MEPDARIERIDQQLKQLEIKIKQTEAELKELSIIRKLIVQRKLKTFQIEYKNKLDSRERLIATIKNHNDRKKRKTIKKSFKNTSIVKYEN